MTREEKREHKATRAAAEVMRQHENNMEADSLAHGAAWAYLEQIDNTKKSRHALAAANIRKELKRAFPGVRFSVRAKSFSGGTSVDIGWGDGPTGAQVKPIISKYEEGNFNGMEDIYDYDRDNMWVGIFGGAKYVMTQRGQTIDGVRSAWVEMGGDSADVKIATYHDGSEYWDRQNSPNGDAIGAAWADKDFTAGHASQ